MIRLLLVASFALLLVACGGDDHAHDHGDHAHDHDHADHADHAHADDGHQHDHAAGTEDDHGHGEAVALPSVTIGGWTVSGERFGEVTAGGEIAAELQLLPEDTVPTAVRAWIGDESGRGSVKAKAEATEHGWQVHVPVPGELPEGSQLWVEIESGDERVRGAVGL